MAKPERLFAKKYRLHALLGRGGMGEVYAATNTFTKAEVAIKCIPPHLATPDLAERMQRESEALAVLIHPNIVRLYDAGVTDEGVVYIVMERIAGESLRTLIDAANKQGVRLDLQLVLHVMALVADAMDFAHIKGIVHRDLKPANIMVAKGGDATVLDFGIAKHRLTAERPAPPAQTDPAAVLGTVHYMAPERIRGRDFDGRSDIYAIGVTLYEAVCGKRPYDACEDASTTMTEVMGHHVFSVPTPIREIVPECPERVWTIIQRCLAKDPAERFATMGELATAVRAALKEHVLAIASTPRKGRPIMAEPSPPARIVPPVELMPTTEIAAASPARVWPIIQRWLARHPADRFAAMSELATSIRAALSAPAPRVERPTEEMPASVQPGGRGAAAAAAAAKDPLPFAPRRPAVPEPAPAAREVRPTEPPLVSYQPPKDPLPFSSRRPIAPEPAPAPREVRSTEPASLDFRARNALPFVRPPHPSHLDVGHAMKTFARGPVSEGSPVAGPEPPEAPAGEGDRHAVFLPGAPPLMPPPRAAPVGPPGQPTGPFPSMVGRDRTPVRPTPATETPPGMTRSQIPLKPEYILIPLAGLVVAAALLVVVMTVRAPRGPAAATTAGPIVVPAPPQPLSAPLDMPPIEPVPTPTHLPSAGPSNSARPSQAAPRRRPGADR